MLDKRTGRLLDTINGFCSGGSFRIVDEEELLGCFSAKDGVDAECVRRMLAYLRDRGYIDVQYAEEGVYCIRPLPEGRLYFERVREKRSDGLRKTRFNALILAGSAFLGSMLGSLLAWLLLSFAV